MCHQERNALEMGVSEKKVVLGVPPPGPFPPSRVVYSVWTSMVWVFSGLVVNTDNTRVPTPNPRKSRNYSREVWIMCSGVDSVSRVTVSVLYWVCGGRKGWLGDKVQIKRLCNRYHLSLHETSLNVENESEAIAFGDEL